MLFSIQLDFQQLDKDFKWFYILSMCHPGKMTWWFCQSQRFNCLIRWKIKCHCKWNRMWSCILISNQENCISFGPSHSIRCFNLKSIPKYFNGALHLFVTFAWFGLSSIAQAKLLSFRLLTFHPDWKVWVTL